MNTRKLFSVLFLAATAIFITLSATAKGSDLMDMTDELDKMDREDLLVLLDKANGCTRQRNFSCSEEQLRKAGKLVHGSSDKLALNTAKQNLQTEKNRVEQEARDKAERERQIRLAEEREAERARERAWEEERERRFAREEEEENDRQSNAQAWAQVLGQASADMSAFNRQMADQNKEIDRLVGQGKQQKRDEQAARIRDQDEQRRRRLSESRQQDQARQQADSRRVENTRRVEQTRKQEQSTDQIHRKQYVQNGFNDAGARASTSELAIEKDIAQLKKLAEEYVASRKYGASLPAHGKITDMRVNKNRCSVYEQTDDEGGYWAKCILDITYEADNYY